MLSLSTQPEISFVPPSRRKEFEAWLQRNRITDLDHPQSFYDYRGAFLAGINKGSNGHWPDTFKQHGHPTFSDESRYATPGDPAAGHWSGQSYMRSSSVSSPAAGSIQAPRPTWTTDDERKRKRALWVSLTDAGLPEPIATQYVESSQPAAPPSLVQQGRTVGRQINNAALKGVGDLMNLIGQGMAPGGPMMMAAAMPGATAGMEGLVNQILPAPEPSSAAGRIGLGAVRGAAGGGPFGVRGAVSGAASGLGAQGVAELGGPGWLQNVTALLAGLAPGGIEAAAGRFGTANQVPRQFSHAVESVGDNPQARLQQALAMAKADPTLAGREALGPQGQALAQRVAREGGTAAEPLVNRTADQASQIASQYGMRKEALTREQSGVRQGLAAQARDRILKLRDEASKAFSQRVGSILKTKPDAGGVALETALDKEWTPKIDRAYNPIRYAPVEVPPELAALLDEPTMRAAWEAGRTNFNPRVTGEPGARTPVEPIPSLMQDVPQNDIIQSLLPGETAPTRPQVRPTLPWAGFDEMKKVLQQRMFDKTISEADRGASSAALSRVDAIIHDFVDPQVPGGAEARNLAQQYNATRDALRFGRGLADAPKARKATRGQTGPATATQADEVQQALQGLTGDQLAIARLGYLYRKMARIEQSAQPWNEVGDVSRAMGLLTPEEIGQIQGAAHQAKYTATGASDPALQGLRTEARALKSTAQDAELQRIQERARGAEQVLGAAEPRPDVAKLGAARRLLADVLGRTVRMAAIDVTSSVAGRSLRPAVRGRLGNVLSSQGPQLEAAIQEWIKRLAPSGEQQLQGAAGIIPSLHQR